MLRYFVRNNNGSPFMSRSLISAKICQLKRNHSLFPPLLTTLCNMWRTTYWNSYITDTNPSLCFLLSLHPSQDLHTLLSEWCLLGYNSYLRSKIALLIFMPPLCNFMIATTLILPICLILELTTTGGNEGQFNV